MWVFHRERKGVLTLTCIVQFGRERGVFQDLPVWVFAELWHSTWHSKTWRWAWTERGRCWSCSSRLWPPSVTFTSTTSCTGLRLLHFFFSQTLTPLLYFSLHRYFFCHGLLASPVSCLKSAWENSFDKPFFSGLESLGILCVCVCVCMCVVCVCVCVCAYVYMCACMCVAGMGWGGERESERSKRNRTLCVCVCV